jgi:hypothetical protein
MIDKCKLLYLKILDKFCAFFYQMLVWTVEFVVNLCVFDQFTQIHTGLLKVTLTLPVHNQQFIFINRNSSTTDELRTRNSSLVDEVHCFFVFKFVYLSSQNYISSEKTSKLQFNFFLIKCI